MRWVPVTTVLGMIISLYGLTLLPPIIIAIGCHEAALLPFVYTFIVCFFFGYTLWSGGAKQQFELRNVEGIMVVVLSWLSLCLISALPFVLGAVDVTVIDAIFEAVSGLTTTGNEVFIGLDQMPRSVQYYHQQLEFVGGLGIIVLATSVLPLLGVGGMEIYQAEIGGPIKDSKLMPRIKETALVLWEIYVVLLVLCTLSYKFCGMSWFEAICGAYGTISTGGFSIHDASFAFYKSRSIEFVAMIFMLLGGLNFALHFSSVYRRNISGYFHNFESKTFLSVLALVITGISFQLYFTGVKPLLWDNFLDSAFTTISMFTTTGLTNTNFSDWPGCLPPLLLFLAMIGGCAGSTSGGIKMMRAIFIYREGVAELKRLSHPKAICTVNHEGEHVPGNIIDSIRGFLSVFLMLYIVMILVVMEFGLNFHDAFAAVTSCMSNAGASIAGVAESFSHLPDMVKVTLIFAMLAGRLEIMTLMILFSRSYWRA